MYEIKRIKILETTDIRGREIKGKTICRLLEWEFEGGDKLSVGPLIDYSKAGANDLNQRLLSIGAGVSSFVSCEERQKFGKLDEILNIELRS